MKIKMQGDYSKSCTDIKLDTKGVLSANCKDLKGVVIATTLDLNNCLVNTDGKLDWKLAGDFTKTTPTVTLTNGDLTYQATNKAGALSASSTFSLNAKVSNNNGQLLCDGIFPRSVTNVCKSPKLDGTKVSLTCSDESGKDVTSTVDLVNVIANNNGKLSVAYKGNYSASATGCTVDATLNLTCANTKDSSGKINSASINLKRVVSVDKTGNLALSGRASKYCQVAVAQNTTTKVVTATYNCVNNKGDVVTTAPAGNTIDLGQLIKNDKGKLKWEKNGNFNQSSSGFNLFNSNLKCVTKDDKGNDQNARIDLDDKIKVNDGVVTATL